MEIKKKDSFINRRVEKYKRLIEKEIEYRGTPSRKEQIDDIFDYRKVLEIRKPKERIISTNGHYGLSYILKRYSGYKKTLLSKSEHGIYAIRSLNSEYEYKIDSIPGIMVPSKARAEFLRDYTDKVILPIGPSVGYAKCIYNSFDLSAVKNNLGKTLLVFPEHSTEVERTYSDSEDFIKYIKEIKDAYGYNTVLVCLYFVDIKTGQHVPYEKEGWTIVSAGNRANYDFNDCLKTIILLSDHVINQRISSNIGYSVYFNKPVTLYNEYNFKMADEFEERLREWRGKYDDYDKIVREFNETYTRLFGRYVEHVTKEQYEWCRKNYGYDDIRKPEELLAYFQFVEEAYKKRKRRVTKEKLLGKYAILKDLVYYNQL